MSESPVVPLFPSGTLLRGRCAWWTVIYHLMRADFYERARRYSFLITLGFVILAAYVYISPKEASYLTLGLGNYRGVYNSAWVGGAVAVLCSSLLSLPAFYLVKNAVERDERTRVGQIIATTPLSKPLYTLGKAFSNFVFLAVMIGVIALAAAGMQLIRGESFRLDLWALLSPFMFCVLPAMAMIAAIAVLFETISWLRGTLGNVVYFFLWLGLLTATAAIMPADPRQIAAPANDIWGISVISSSMMQATAAAFPAYEGSFTIGAAKFSAPLQTFTWEGIHWTSEIILGRLLWFGAAIGLSLIAAIFFRRFDPAPLRRGKPEHAHKAVTPEPGEPEREEIVAPAGVLVTVLTGSGVAVNFALAAEWTHLLAWGTAALFIPTLALVLGAWSGGNKLFEVVYMLWWYAGPMNHVPYLDFIGTGEQVNVEALPVYWTGTAILLGLAVLGRRRQAQARSVMQPSCDVKQIGDIIVQKGTICVFPTHSRWHWAFGAVAANSRKSSTCSGGTPGR